MSDGVLVYDDDCGFCTWSAEFVAERSTLRLVGFSELDDDLLSRLPDDYEECAHLVTDERVYSCGAAMEEALLRSDLGSVARPAAESLRDLGPYRIAREWGYRRVADNRDLFGKVLSKRPPARGREGSSESDRSDADSA